jgi:hypothetical protein
VAEVAAVDSQEVETADEAGHEASAVVAVAAAASREADVEVEASVVDGVVTKYLSSPEVTTPCCGGSGHEVSFALRYRHTRFQPILCDHPRRRCGV